MCNLYHFWYFSHIGQSPRLPFSRQYEIPWLFQTKIKLLPWFQDHLGGFGGMLTRKFSKLESSTWLKMNFRQQNSLTLGILSQIPWLSGSLSNSLTFPGFPGQWQPCKAVTFQQFFNWFCFVPLWLSLSYGFASWEGSLALAFYGQNKTGQREVCHRIREAGDWPIWGKGGGRLAQCCKGEGRHIIS